MMITLPNFLTPVRHTISRVLPELVRRTGRKMFGHDTMSITEYRRKYDLSQLQACERALNRHGYSLTQFSSILYFGCGLGRLTAYLPGIAQRASLFGCDVDVDSVAVCRRQCPSGTFYVNAPQVPLEYEDDQFDFIWSYSVFTHFSEPAHEMWLKELARVLAPGGVMLHTTHSSEYLQCVATFSPAALDKYHLPNGVEGFIQDEKGYHFQPFDPIRANHHKQGVRNRRLAPCHRLNFGGVR